MTSVWGERPALPEASGDGPLDPPAGVTFSPAFYGMQGRAEGFAAALGGGSSPASTCC